MSKKVIVLGGGPAGAMTAIMAARDGAQTKLYERSGEILASVAAGRGGTGCLGSCADDAGLIAGTYRNGEFMKHAFISFEGGSSIHFFDTIGVRTTFSEGGMLTPLSGDGAFVKECVTDLCADSRGYKTAFMRAI